MHVNSTFTLTSVNTATASPDYRPCTCEDVPAAASISFTSDVIPPAPDDVESTLDDVHAQKMISQALEMTWKVSHKTR